MTKKEAARVSEYTGVLIGEFTELNKYKEMTENDIRKETAKEIFSWIFRNLVNLNFITGNVELSLVKLQNFAKIYDIELFGNSEQVEKEDADKR